MIRTITCTALFLLAHPAVAGGKGTQFKPVEGTSGCHDNGVKVIDGGTHARCLAFTGGGTYAIVTFDLSNGQIVSKAPIQQDAKMWFGSAVTEDGALVAGADASRFYAWSPDGQTVHEDASSDASTAFSYTADRFVTASGAAITIYDTSDWSRVAKWDHERKTATDRPEVAVRGGEQPAVASTWRRTLELRLVDADAAAWSIPLQSDISTLAFSPDGKQLAYGLVGGGLQVVDAGTGAKADAYTWRGKGATTLAWSDDGTRVAVGLYNGVQAFRLGEKSAIVDHVLGQTNVSRVAVDWTPSGQLVAIFSDTDKGAHVGIYTP